MLGKRIAIAILYQRSGIFASKHLATAHCRSLQQGLSHVTI